LKSWFDVRRRRLGSWAFALNRLTGIGLTLYLLIHLGLLSLLLQGEEAWDDFIALARSPFFLTLDVLLLFGILFHGLNGIRLVLVGIGVGIRNQRSMFWVLMVIGFVLLASGAILIFTL
jgi:succinate dehydrogenase / fumarate reductase cytochrome b subunit